MSIARLVITALFVDRQSPAEAAARYGVHRSWVYRLKARYETEGESAAAPRSRRPHTSPTAAAVAVVERILELRDTLAKAGLDAGPDTIVWHLANEGIQISAATVARKLTTADRVTPQPHKRPKSSYVRFEAKLPNETWQADFTHYQLADGTDAEILTWLDDHSRYALSVTAHHRVSGPIVLTTFRKTVASFGIPATTLTDNGMVFTTRFAGGRGGRSALEHELRRLHITQKNSRPNHPTTCGKGRPVVDACCGAGVVGSAVVGLASGSIARVDRLVAVRHAFVALVACMKPCERSWAWGHSLSRPQLGWVMPILDPHDVSVIVT